MLEQKSNESLMGSQWGTMYNQWGFLLIILRCIAEFEPSALSKIYLIGR
jgi:hypothetical protein